MHSNCIASESSKKFVKGNIWSLDSTFVSHYFIQLQCTLLLGDFYACVVIGNNPKHERRILSNILSLYSVISHPKQNLKSPKQHRATMYKVICNIVAE